LAKFLFALVVLYFCWKPCRRHCSHSFWTSSSVLISKIQGNIVDALMPPLSAGELTFAYAMGGMTRGLAVAVATAVPLSFLTNLTIENFAALVFFAASGALMLSLIGVIGGIWADKFDHMAAVTNFVIMPLAFLSGTFYSIERLPETFQAFSAFNPFFYTIDGFRAGFIGQGDTSLATGVVVMSAINISLWAICHRMFAVGWRLKP
ncbi:MAG: ABC transporter permease, partial [Alphaproteobacteria bacterium]